MITADQLVAHAAGDYLLQSHWMAANKTKDTWACLAHVLTYSLPFLLVGASFWAWLAIAGSHFVIDRWRLARYVVRWKNVTFDFGGPVWPPPSRAEIRARLLAPMTATGYPDDVPPWLATWLLIIADNVLHVLCNGLALRYL